MNVHNTKTNKPYVEKYGMGVINTAALFSFLAHSVSYHTHLPVRVSGEATIDHARAIRSRARSNGMFISDWII